MEVYVVSSIGEDMYKGSVAFGHRCFRKEEDVRRVGIQHVDDIRHRGAVCSSFLNVEC